MLRAITDSLLSLAFPDECRVCGAPVESLADGAVCESCWRQTKIFTGNEMLCNKCGAFFSDSAAAVPVYCRRCDDHLYEKAFAVGVYEKALAASILELKKDPSVPRRLFGMIQAAVERLPGVDLIMPVPLSKLRHLERGYNQAEVIGRCVSRSMGVPVDTLTLGRKKHTPLHRMGMDQRARELTVEKAFEVTRPNLIIGRSILLVDDVLTSGSTAAACSNTLMKSGAGRVNVFTLARAVMH